MLVISNNINAKLKTIFFVRKSFHAILHSNLLKFIFQFDSDDLKKINIQKYVQDTLKCTTQQFLGKLYIGINHYQVIQQYLRKGDYIIFGEASFVQISICRCLYQISHNLVVKRAAFTGLFSLVFPKCFLSLLQVKISKVRLMIYLTDKRFKNNFSYAICEI